MEEILDSLKLYQFGIDMKKVDDNTYTSKLIDSNLYQDLFEYFNGVSDLELDEESVVVDESVNKVTFNGPEYTISLNANFDTEDYEIIVRGDSK